MASHNVYTFFSVHNCLDEDFDAPDAMADTALCRAIVAGRCEVHPDVWSDQPALTVPPPRFRRNYEEVEPVYSRPVERPPRPKPWRPYPPKPRPAWRPYTPEWQPTIGWTDPPAHGEVQLTCDDCRARFRVTMHYRGNRPDVVQSIRLLGKDEGWTCIAGTDRCPRCSQAAAPEPVGNGTGGNQGDEQHA
jgi:hypothetical protein